MTNGNGNGNGSPKPGDIPAGWWFSDLKAHATSGDRPMTVQEFQNVIGHGVAGRTAEELSTTYNAYLIDQGKPDLPQGSPFTTNSTRANVIRSAGGTVISDPNWSPLGIPVGRVGEALVNLFTGGN